jgi:periplasmic divalent cation tolerance protein
VNIVIFITAKDIKEANGISQALIKTHLAACVNIIRGVQSLFWWDGKVDAANEVLLIVKSKQSYFKKITKVVKSLHSYQTPEIIALPIIDGEKKYLKWLNESCCSRGKV